MTINYGLIFNEPLSPMILVQIYLTAVFILTLNALRTLGAHRWTSHGGEMTFVLKKDTKVLVNGKAATLADLRTGDKVQVNFEKLDDVLSVTATREG